MKIEDLPLKYQKMLIKYADERKLTAKEKAKVDKKFIRCYKDSVYDPEEAIGVVTAQSLSEPATQMTMRTYHFAGTAGVQVTLGLPRIIEIFDARKKPKTPAMTVYILPEYQELEKVRKIAEEIKEVKARDIVDSTTLDLTDVYVKCKINKSKLRSLGLKFEELPKTVKVRGAKAEIQGNYLIIKPKKKKDVSYLHKLKFRFFKSHIKGIKGVTQVVVTKEDGEWIISTMGSNLKKVFKIEGVDPNRTTSNHIHEVEKVLGIEAARNNIVRQAVYTLDEQGLEANIRYVMLLSDLMTHTGTIRAIGRYGISGEKASILVRASFEETKKHLINASITGERDNIEGTIENIIMNQVAPIGTGAFKLVGGLPSDKGKKKKTKKKPLKKVSSKKKKTKKKKKKSKKKPLKKVSSKKKKTKKKSKK